MVGIHLHLASGVDSILHQVMLVLPAMVHRVIVESTGLPDNLKVVGTRAQQDLHPWEQWMITPVGKSPLR